MGLGVGAAATGCRPVIDVMFMDFMGECMDEIANQLAKMRYMFGGRATLPVTVLTMAGAGASLAAQHSQSLEAWICHIPGLKVTMASTPYDAKGLIISAARDDNPVFVILNKMSLAMKGHVPEEPYTIPLGRGEHRPRRLELHHHRHRPDGARGTFRGRATHRVSGVDAEVIDPRTLQPFDTDTAGGFPEENPPGDDRARGRAFRRHWRRDRRTASGAGVRLARCAPSPGSAPRSRRCPSARHWSRTTSRMPNGSWRRRKRSSASNPRIEPGTSLSVGVIGLVANPASGKDVRRPRGPRLGVRQPGEAGHRQPRADRRRGCRARARSLIWTMRTASLRAR